MSTENNEDKKPKPSSWIKNPNMPQAEVEAQIRSAKGILGRNAYRRLYREARDECGRMRVVERMASYMTNFYGCPVPAQAAARKILLEPPESERICETCKWYTPITQTACLHPARRGPEGRTPQVGPEDTCERFEACTLTGISIREGEPEPVMEKVKFPNTPESDAQSHVWWVVEMSDGSTLEVFARDAGEALRTFMRQRH